jgi:hypothetical protein
MKSVGLPITTLEEWEQQMAQDRNMADAQMLAGGVDPKLVGLRQFALTASIKLHTSPQDERPSELVQSSVVLKDAERFMGFLLGGTIS